MLAALGDVLAAGGLVVAVGASAAALCDPMLDQRGGAFTLGLGLVRGVAVVPEAETWSEERLHRTLSLADTPFVELPTGLGAASGDGDGWELVGDARRSTASCREPRLAVAATLARRSSTGSSGDRPSRG